MTGRLHPSGTVLGAVLLSAAIVAWSDEPLTMAGVMEAAAPTDWRRIDQADLMYVDLPHGRVVIEVAPAFAPMHVANVRTLTSQKYFDGLAVLRSQDNYVVQWGDPDADEDDARRFGAAAANLAPEFFRAASGLEMTVLDSADAYADSVGYVQGFPAGRDEGRAWLTHCYGMVGVARGSAADSGNGAQLYVVIGHAPRHLDRNVTMLGRVVHGMQQLSTLPRGSGSLGFYESGEERTSIVSVRFGDQIPAADRLALEALRTDTATFSDLIEARRTRLEDWFIDPAGHIGLCNVPLPVRVAP